MAEGEMARVCCGMVSGRIQQRSRLAYCQPHDFFVRFNYQLSDFFGQLLIGSELAQGNHNPGKKLRLFLELDVLVIFFMA